MSPGCSSRNGGRELLASSSFSRRGAIVKQLDGKRTGIKPTNTIDQRYSQTADGETDWRGLSMAIHNRPSFSHGSSRRAMTLGRALGSLFNILSIIWQAEWLRRLLAGMLYSFFLIRAYVSLSELVSNGGRPHSRVYLNGETIGDWKAAQHPTETPTAAGMVEVVDFSVTPWICHQSDHQRDHECLYYCSSEVRQ